MNIVLLSVGVALFAISTVLIGYSVGASSGKPKTDEPVGIAATASPVPTYAPIVTQTAPSVPEAATPNASILIPGFDKLTVKGLTLNAGNIKNSAQNSCYLVAALLMPDSAEVYRSGYLAPGQTLGNAVMASPLAPGTYEGATVRYYCYTLDNLTPLNGADISITLEVSANE